MHAYNNGLLTSMKGAALQAARITGLNVANGSACTIAEQSASGFIASVTHTAAGIYTVRLATPVPPRLVICIPALSGATETTDLLTAKYDSGSYNASTGTFVINVSNDDDSGAPVAADGSASDELHLLMVFRTKTLL